jgi:hypothetical protein
MRTIRVLFLKPDVGDHWMNRLVAYIDPPYCHVELEFETMTLGTNGQNVSGTIATSIFNGETIFMRPRTFANPKYEVVSILVSNDSFNKIYGYCNAKCNSNVTFDNIGMILSYFPFTFRSAPTDKTFCSSYITSALQCGGIDEVKHLKPERTSPSTLYKIMQKCNGRCFSTVPFKMQLMNSKTLTFTLPDSPLTVQ